MNSRMCIIFDGVVVALCEKIPTPQYDYNKKIEKRRVFKRFEYVPNLSLRMTTREKFRIRRFLRKAMLKARGK